jgi:hypothetical protein
MTSKRAKQCGFLDGRPSRPRSRSVSEPRVSKRARSANAGRPTLCRPALVERIYSAVREGVTRRAAALACGVSSRTFHNWITRGAAGEQPFLQFVQRIERAEAEWQGELEIQILEAGKRDWRAAAWLLERRCAAEYSTRERAQHGDRDADPQKVEHVIRWVTPGTEDDTRKSDSSTLNAQAD